jgi:hypothetical protein
VDAKKFLLVLLATIVATACTPSEPPDDRAIIEKVADDLEAAVSSGDLLKVDEHLSLQAKRQGFEANGFLMDCSYGDSVSPSFTARTIKVMGDSAHLAFALMPTGMQYADSLPRSIVRLVKANTWMIVSFHVTRNLPAIEADSASDSL